MKSLFGENAPHANLGQQSVRGGVVSIAARGINAAVQVASVVCLARLLSPEDYGLVAMVTALIGIAPLAIDVGTRTAIIQQTRIAPDEISALFWITFAIGSGFALLVAASGPWIARFYHEPRLTLIALVSSLSIVGYAVVCQHIALLSRAMRYKSLAVIDVTANTIGTIAAVAIAVVGWKYWALVMRPIVVSAVTAIGVWSACGWVPGKPKLTQGAKEMLRFGVHIIGFSGADFVARFADRVAIGYARGASPLGFYQKACLVYDNSLDLVITPLHPVAMTSLSKLRNNTQELCRSWAKGLTTVAFFTMPAFGLLAVTSRDVIPLVLGEKWRYAGVLLSILALRGIPHVVLRTVGWLHTAAGRSDRLMRWGLIATVAQVIALFAGLPFGVTGIAWAYVMCTYVLFLPGIAYAGRPLGIGLRQVITAIGPPVAGALGATAVGFLLHSFAFARVTRVERLLALTLCYSALYLVVVIGVFKVTTPLRTARKLFEELVLVRATLLFCRPSVPGGTKPL